MANRTFDLILLPGTFAICRLDPDSPIPDLPSRGFWSITRSDDELSIVCEQEFVPSGARSEREWRCLRVAGTIDFSITGVIASFATSLAAANVGVFIVSTFDTDFLLVKTHDLESAIAALKQAGHVVR